MRIVAVPVVLLISLAVAARSTKNGASNVNDLELYTAIDSGDNDLVSRILDQGYSIDRSSSGTTPLMRACASGQIETVRMLIGRGADVNASNDLGWTPLMVATLNKKSQVASLLIQSGADPYVKSEQGSTALDMAVNSEDEDLERILGTAMSTQASVPMTEADYR